MRLLSVCSGIEAASVAWHPLGWEAAALSEIEPFPCSALAYRSGADIWAINNRTGCMKIEIVDGQFDE